MTLEKQTKATTIVLVQLFNMDVFMSNIIPERLSQLNKKIISGRIEQSELLEYKSLLELSCAIMRVHKIKNGKRELLNEG